VLAWSTIYYLGLLLVPYIFWYTALLFLVIGCLSPFGTYFLGDSVRGNSSAKYFLAFATQYPIQILLVHFGALNPYLSETAVDYVVFHTIFILIFFNLTTFLLWWHQYKNCEGTGLPPSSQIESENSTF
jgi:cytochrome c biogenesis factor